MAVPSDHHICTDLQRQVHLSLEKEIFGREFRPEEFSSKDLIVNIVDGTFLHYTTISRVQQTTSNVLVCLHGYAGLGAVFYRLIKELANDYYIVLVDLPDMGFSSRHNEPLFSTTLSTIDFFVSALEVFLQKMCLHQFTLIGHSIGAYLATYLFKKLHANIFQLFLLSPAGFNKPGDLEFEERRRKFIENMSYIKKIIYLKVEKNIFVKKYSPFELFYLPTWVKKWFFQKYWFRPRFKMQPRESFLFSEIFGYFMTLPQQGERCLGYLLHNGVKSTHPIIDVLVQLNSQKDKIHIFFGDEDWMDSAHTEKSLTENNLDITIYIVPDSEHQLIFQNPVFIASCIRTAAQQFKC